MDDVSSSLMLTMTAAKDGYDIAKDALSVITGLLTGLKPNINSTRIVDRYNKDMNLDQAVLDYANATPVEHIDGEVVFGDGFQDIVVRDIPNDDLPELIDRMTKEDILYLFANTDGPAPICGTSRLLTLKEDSETINKMYEELQNENLEQYEVESGDPGYLAAALGSDEDHAIVSITGIPMMEAAEIAKELRRNHVYYQMELDNTGTSYEIRVAETEEQKLKDFFVAAKLDKAIEGVEDNPIMLADAMKTEAYLARDAIAKNRSPLEGGGPLKPMVIFDAADPSHRLEIDTHGLREIAFDKAERSVSSRNAAYRNEIGIAVKTLRVPVMVETAEFEAMYKNYNKEMAEYNAKIRDKRDELISEMNVEREKYIKNAPEIHNIIEKELELEEQLKSEIESGSSEIYDIVAYKSLIDESDITLGEVANEMALYDRSLQLGLLEEEELQFYGDFTEDIEAKGKDLYESRMQKEKEIKEIEAPKIEGIENSFMENFEARILREARHKNLYKSIELQINPETGQLELSAKENFEDLAPVYRKEAIEIRLNEAINTVNAELEGMTIERDIATPVFKDDRTIHLGLEQEVPAQDQVANLESEVAQADHEIEMPGPSDGGFE